MIEDQKSLAQLNTLHPKIRQAAIAAYLEARDVTPANVQPVITQGYRTFAESAKLYAQGRTTPGPIVTKAKPGQSYHNYGLALDFANKVNDKIEWKVDANWMKVVEVFKKHGFTWGGDFKTIKDAPHFELTFGTHWSKLLELRNLGKVDCEGYVEF